MAGARRIVISSIEFEYRRYKTLAERAMGQVTDDEVAVIPSSDGNSIAMLVQHMSGNLKSRFTDFLASDGEKPWRDRSSEFLASDVTRAALMTRWEDGWSVLFDTLAQLDDEALGRHVTIRGEAHSVLEALHRSLAHASYHVGQIVLIAKSFRGEQWKPLSIPKARPARP